MTARPETGWGRSPGIVAVAVAILGVAAGCRDYCVDVVCQPAPPPLEVVVLDTISVDTSIVITRIDPDTSFVVDTILVLVRPTIDAVVTLERIQGADSVTFDTVPIADSLFRRVETAGLPSEPFVIRARRGNRSRFISDAKLQSTTGCCSYPIVGRFNLRLPVEP